MTEQYANNASSTLNGAITNSATTLVVASASSFPTSGNFRIIVDSEIMLVTGVAGTTFTITRGIESTTAVSHASGVPVTHILTAGGLQNKPINNTIVYCSANINLGSGWTDVTGCSLSLTSGTWLVMATVCIANTNNTQTASIKLYYGSTDLVSQPISLIGGFQMCTTTHAIVTLSSTQTVTLAGQLYGSSWTIYQYNPQYNPAASGSIPATYISAIQLA